MSKQGYDLVIRDGLVIDGSGGEPFIASIAIDAGLIVAVGDIDGAGREEIHATGCIVTPGFVDIHTHFDGQATWSQRLSPSSELGVTTVVMGNCGVGFAPCRAHDRQALVQLMEGVEDIPGAVMQEGLPWEWESFPEYMDFLAKREFDIDIAVLAPHAPIRVYAMGDRGLMREPANANDLARMKDLVAEAVAAGALGVSTSRSLNHRSSDLQLMPGVSASDGELIALANGIAAGHGKGFLQMTCDFESPELDFDMLRRVGEATGVPLTFALLLFPHAPERWKRILALTEDANRAGVVMRPQVFCRPVGSILGLKQNYNPFSFSPSYSEIATLPLEERIAIMRDPAVRRRIISEFPTITQNVISRLVAELSNAFPWGDEPDYTPGFEASIKARADKHGVPAVEFAYDLLLEDRGRNVFYMPIINFGSEFKGALAQMLNHKDTIFGLGDAGAHVGVVCDASGQTYMLQRWVGDGRHGTMSLAKVVRSLTRDVAEVANLRDRGLLRPSYRADINVIDIDALRLRRPEMIHDMPLGGGRFIQRAEGYVATLVNGLVTYCNGQATGTLPGRLIRGAQPDPASAATLAA